MVKRFVVVHDFDRLFTTEAEALAWAKNSIAFSNLAEPADFYVAHLTHIIRAKPRETSVEALDEPLSARPSSG